MTDPFADLEQELRAAHARDVANPRAKRFRGTASVFRPALVTLAVAAIAVAAVAFLASDGAEERAASPGDFEEGWTAYAPEGDGGSGDHPPGTGCGKPYRPEERDGPAPGGITSELRILRDAEAGAVVHVPGADGFLWGAQARVLYKDAYASVERAGKAVLVQGAEAIPHSAVKGRPDFCAPPEGDAENAACLGWGTGKGLTGACYSIEEVVGRKAVLDVSPESKSLVVGLAPDGVERVTLKGRNGATHEAEVEDNVWIAELNKEFGPPQEAEISFEDEDSHEPPPVPDGGTQAGHDNG